MKLLHWILGHKFRLESACFCGGSNQVQWGSTEADFCKTWGFTQFLYYCDCGTFKQFRVPGKQELKAGADRELDALRGMTGL
jgi:hypothetical protein